MKKNTLLLFGAVLVLGSLIYYFQFVKDSKNSISDKTAWKRDFAIPDTDKIHTVMIDKMSGLSIKLTRKDDYWMVNDKYRANENVVQTLLSTAAKLELQRTPIAKEAENIVKYINKKGTSVRYYDENSEKMKSYFIGGGDLEGTGTAMIMEGSDQPYIVSMPYFQGILSFRFGRQEFEWRDNVLLRLDPEKISGVSIEYPKQKSNSFELVKEGKDYFVKKMFDLQNEGLRKVNPAQVRDYLGEFERKIVEGYENKNPIRDSILTTVPFCIVKVDLDEETSKTLKFFERESRYASGKEKTDDVFRFFCWAEAEEDFSLVQLGTFQDLFRSHDFFISK